MSIPNYQDFMYEILKLAADREDHLLRDELPAICRQLNILDEEQKKLVPSGKQTVVSNRANWALTYLAKAKAVERTGRGSFKITNRGLWILAQNPTKLNNEYLKQFPEFLEFKTKTKPEENGTETNSLIQADDTTPEELIESTYQEIRESLADEILEKIATCSPAFFERLVVDLLVAMGYGGSRRDAGEAIGRSGDEGIDGIINQDRLGLDIVYIQAKRWKGTVGRPDIQAFTGSLEGKRANKGVFITTSQFSQDAKNYVAMIHKKIILIDGFTLAQLMIDYRVGVSEVTSYAICQVDHDYYE